MDNHPVKPADAAHTASAAIDRIEAPRRSYERPSILSEEIFETLALACGKASGTFQCSVSTRS